jgi:hypothetical protein
VAAAGENRYAAAPRARNGLRELANANAVEAVIGSDVVTAAQAVTLFHDSIDELKQIISKFNQLRQTADVHLLHCLFLDYLVCILHVFVT